jgi:uncharacterized phage protein (TIGR01671 family)
MEREILFRGRNGSEWHYGYICSRIVNTGTGEEHHHIVFRDGMMMRVDPATVGQYTGLCDKNGTRIFESDIVSVFDMEGVVRFGEHGTVSEKEKYHVGFYVEWCNEMDRNQCRNELAFWIKQYAACVIGNVYDNPELLADAERED